MSATDDLWEERLRDAAAQADPPPDSVLEAARAALALRSLDAELATLTADSWADAETVTTRAVTADLRMLTFECGEVTLEIDVETDHVTGLRSLRGVVVGDVVGLTLVHPDRRAPLPLESGSFEARDLPAGPVRIEAVTADGRRVTTTWVTL